MPQSLLKGHEGTERCRDLGRPRIRSGGACLLITASLRVICQLALTEASLPSKAGEIMRSSADHGLA